MRVIRTQAVQVHPVPDKVTSPEGPFPPHLRGYNPWTVSGLTSEGADLDDRDTYIEQAHPAAQSELVYPDPAYSEDGSGFLPGSTAQNSFNPVKYLRCSVCFVRVAEHETSDHVCEIGRAHV